MLHQIIKSWLPKVAFVAIVATSIAAGADAVNAASIVEPKQTATTSQDRPFLEQLREVRERGNEAVEQVK